ncbi:MAG TPA: NAD(P)-dependent oxidoreductase [Xanthobacteraceae bacterium]|nr:NAD(P)-dependent oxidoreductase [Xanthobacteraceae bacterium]
MAELSIQTVGIIGLGKMGNPMARLLAAKGFSVVGYDLSEAACQAAANHSVAIAKSPAELAQKCGLVIVVTGFEHEAEAALFGENGVIAGARQGTVVAVASTISPSGMRGIAKRLEAHGLVPLDIPLCRGEPAAEAGKLLITGGGDKAAFERCRPAFSAFADAIFHLGPVGAGQVGKMVNNLILWACISANHEGLMLGERLGVDRSAMREMLLQSSAANWPLETGAGDRPMPWAEKDMMIVLAEADAARLSLPLCGVIKEVIKGIKVARGE